MTRISRIVLLSLGLLFSLAASAQVERGSKSLGLRGGYVTRTEAGTAGLAFQYSFTRHFRLAGEVDYFFRKQGSDGASFNIDYQCPLSLGGKFYIYPIAGVSFTSWHHRPVGDLPVESIDDTSSRVTHIGLNFGGGVEYYVKPSLKLSVDGKFNWVKDYNTGIFNLGISYVF